MKLFKEMIIENNSLRFLNLESNSFGSNFEGTKLLKEMMIKNETITHLNLESNNLGSNIEGLELLKKLIVCKKTFLHLDFKDNFHDVDEETEKIFLQMESLAMEKQIYLNLDKRKVAIS